MKIQRFLIFVILILQVYNCYFTSKFDEHFSEFHRCVRKCQNSLRIVEKLQKKCENSVKFPNLMIIFFRFE